MTVARRYAIAVITVIAVVMGVTPTVANAGTATAKTTSSNEIGITKSTIRIGVVADVDNPLAPGAFKGSVDGVQAWAKYVNRSGGLAGRKVEVDFIDSHLSANDARNAIITACANDFALLATSALFLNNVDDLISCKDAQGAATGLPDIANLTTSVAQSCSPVTFPVLPPQLDCATKDAHPQTYRAASGSAFYLLKKQSGLQGMWLLPSDLKSVNNAAQVVAAGQVAAGIGDGSTASISGAAPQSAYTPIVNEIRSGNLNYAESVADYNSTVSLRKEAALQGVSSVKVWNCSQACYSPKFLSAGGADVEGEYVYMPSLPTEEAKDNKSLATLLKYVGIANANQFAVQAWTSGLLFQDAVNAIASKKDGANSLTRAALLQQLKATHSFDAGGIIGPTDIGGKAPSPCYVLLQVKDGKFVRVHPSKPATFDCNAKNVESVKLDLAG